MDKLRFLPATLWANTGSGMGLAICKKIMEMHGGFIAAEGERAKGASFQCYFPL
jgi:two-component system CheB/CheR fusion protein